MKNCTISVYLAYTMAAYFFSSIYYLIVSRFAGTPFYDSLTKKQEEIKNKSVKTRRNIFHYKIVRCRQHNCRTYTRDVKYSY